MTDYAEITNIARLVSELDHLNSIKALTTNQIERLFVAATTTTSRVYQMQAVPTDSGWAAALAALNTMVTGKITAVKAQLVALGVTNIP